MINVLSVIGTRPEAVKMAPVVKELEKHAKHVKSVICVTGQHREMLDQVLTVFGITPDHDLSVMQPDQGLSELTARILSSLSSIIIQEEPDWILAQGDTTTVLAAALNAYYHRVLFGHVEAGLRTRNRFEPFPEEMNRRLADALADRCFAPTEHSRRQLLAEGVSPERVLVTGNTVIDALQIAASLPYEWAGGPLSLLPQDRRLVLVTAHRRESFGDPLNEICLALRKMAVQFEPLGVHFVYPVHLNPNVREPVYRQLADVPGISLIEPLDYLSMVQLMKRSILILTDSGGIQEEAPAFGVPVLVLRDRTERPEGIEAGVARLVGTSQQAIIDAMDRLLRDEDEYAGMARGTNPYGDGRAAQRIVDSLLAG